MGEVFSEISRGESGGRRRSDGGGGMGGRRTRSGRISGGRRAHKKGPATNTQISTANDVTTSMTHFAILTILTPKKLSVEKLKSQLRVMTKMGQLWSTMEGRFRICWSFPVY